MACTLAWSKPWAMTCFAMYCDPTTTSIDPRWMLHDSTSRLRPCLRKHLSPQRNVACPSCGDRIPVMEASHGPGVFATTHWSVVLAAGDTTSPARTSALEQLCQSCWYPV